ncbi:UNVERIFIED_CONTAM: hypothetical protein Sradi_6956800 [Sesamum radiatum]|uniref:Reverse transcriptase domain-containing protein n=1 Tax=Sesamum radiatum TaxID=300843 RepID=A0AAW2JFH7_SESRA
MAEIKEAFFDIDVESAPGPDGYTSAFYRSAWPVIRQTLFQAIGEFFRTGKLLKQVNTTLIALIPKVNLPMYVSDYRPIACCNVLYKAITKIIVKRMQRVLPLLIDYSQNAFVPGRSITDNILLAKNYCRALIRQSGRTTGRLEPPEPVLRWSAATYKAVLSTLHMYWASAFILPKGVLKNLEKKMRKFLWYGSSGSGNAKVAWERICKPKEEGGLGLHSLITTNQALMLKQLWRIIQNDGTSIWVDWIQHYRLRHSTIWTFNGALGHMARTRSALLNISSRTYSHGPPTFFTSVQRDTEESVCWPAQQMLIFKTSSHSFLQYTLQQQTTFLGEAARGKFKIPRHGFILWLAILEKLSTMDKPWGLQYRVGDGCTFRLWQDIWHEQGPLCLSFPRGPTVTDLPLDAHLSEVLMHGQWVWPTLTDPDINEIVSHLPPIYTNSPDKVIWRHNSGQFTVQSAIELIQPRINRVEWHGLLQGRYKIPRHTFILWLAFLEKLSTSDKAWLAHGDNGCVLCNGQSVETHEHLFFKCQYSRRCLNIIQREVRFHWPKEGWQQGITWASKRWRSPHLINAAFRALLAALVYHLWIERNNRKFTDTGSAAESVAKRVIEDIRLRIMSEETSLSLQTRALYRTWKIAWPHTD